MPDLIRPNVVPMSFKKMIKNVSRRNKGAHKGDFGHTLLIGGNTGFSGAIRLSAEAALRVGSGLVSVATRQEHVAAMAMSRPELMCHGVDKQLQIKKLTKQSSAIALGPGLGQDAWAIHLFEATLESNKLMVLDADALNVLAKEPRKNEQWLLTPHVGEAARLLNCSTSEIQQDRAAAITQLQQQYDGVIVLKGAGSLVFDGGDNIFICDAGNPGMASGGVGDVLTGVIAGLIAQGLTLIDAAKLGVMIHAMAGDCAAKKGEKGLIASDLMQPIRELMNDH
ncbi:MAG TPA: NAD(P)H-hydrate dehydratase [Cycloclasticus sp.]|jgi:NAD(P)H-hydrate epimerase|nr:NAD(P)H-hydrate dehydratase [Cycloclasticus sp.]HIL91480.1 NAD(P)H-hydrate dehydratase [Cycloclasticus sp.]